MESHTLGARMGLADGMLDQVLANELIMNPYLIEGPVPGSISQMRVCMKKLYFQIGLLSA